MSLIPLGFSDFVARGGKIRLICSPQLTQSDFEVVTSLGKPVDDIGTLLGNLQLLVDNADPDKQLLAKVFSSLLASGILEMRIAKTDMAGIFHDKVGIFEDAEGNRVSFIGSANETAAAWSGLVNHENLEVFNETSSSSDSRRVAKHIIYFEDLWGNKGDKVTTIDVRVADKEIYEVVAPEPLADIIQKIRKRLKKVPGDSLEPQQPIALRDYQAEALQNWENSQKKGVICFATGGGKTITCIEAVSRWTSTGAPAIVLVPTEYLLNQWANEFNKWFPMADLLIVGGKGNGFQKWGKYLEPFTRMGTPETRKVVIATYASARSENFKSRVKTGTHLMVAADEVHNFGATLNREIGDWLVAGAKLGMSATPERKWDESGTNAIFDYFGNRLEPQFTLEDALAAKVLSEYDYFYEECELTEDEDLAWKDLTDQFVRAWLASGKKMTKKVTDLLILRSRISKAAANKTSLTVDILKNNFHTDDRWLVYCESIAHLDEVSEAIRLEQIPGLQVLEYHSRNSVEHSQAIQFLSQTGGVMLAVKCLDEGVDLPRVNKAIILASSTNPREYIQRRGRVLRRHPDKTSAQIYDLLTFRYQTQEPATCGEIERALHFAKSARNKASSLSLEQYSQLCKAKEQIPDEISEDLEDA
jgi:superfamily II DNA or RNA helicase